MNSLLKAAAYFLRKGDEEAIQLVLSILSNAKVVDIQPDEIQVIARLRKRYDENIRSEIQDLD